MLAVVLVTLGYLLISIGSQELLVYISNRGFKFIGIIYGLQAFFIYPTFLVCYHTINLLERDNTNKKGGSISRKYFTELNIFQKKFLKFYDAALLKAAQTYLSRWTLAKVGSVHHSYTTVLVLPMTLVFEYFTVGYIERSKFSYLGMIFLMCALVVGIQKTEERKFLLIITFIWAFLSPSLNIVQKKRTNELVNGNPVHATVIMSFFTSTLMFLIALYFREPWTHTKNEYKLNQVVSNGWNLTEFEHQIYSVGFWDWLTSSPDCWLAMFVLVFLCGFSVQVFVLLLLDVVSLTTQVVVTSAIKPIIAEIVGISLRGKQMDSTDIQRFALKVLGSLSYVLGGLSISKKKSKINTRPIPLEFSSETSKSYHKKQDEKALSEEKKLQSVGAIDEGSLVLSIVGNSQNNESHSECLSVEFANISAKKFTGSEIFDIESGRVHQSESLTYESPISAPDTGIGYNTFENDDNKK